MELVSGKCSGRSLSAKRIHDSIVTAAKDPDVPIALLPTFDDIVSWVSLYKAATVLSTMRGLRKAAAQVYARPAAAVPGQVVWAIEGDNVDWSVIIVEALPVRTMVRFWVPLTEDTPPGMIRDGNWCYIKEA